MIAYNLKASESEDVRVVYAKLLRDKKHIQALIEAMEKDIRAGKHPEHFDLIDPPYTPYVPKKAWEDALGEDWVKKNQIPMNKKPVIVAKK